MRETSQAQRAFSDYLAQSPPRSLRALIVRYQSEDKPPTRRFDTLAQWSKEHAWQERIAQHEKKLAEQAAVEEAEERKRARKQRLQVARGARSKGVEALTLLGPQELAHLPSAIIRLLSYADETERKDLGEPDQRVDHEHRGHLDVDVQDARQQLAGRLARIATRLGEGSASREPE